MSDEDSTVIRSVRKALSRERQYPDDRRSPAPINYLAYLPLLLACLSGVWGYATLTSEVKTLQRDLERTEQAHEKDMQDYLGWNKGISERLRELERR